MHGAPRAVIPNGDRYHHSCLVSAPKRSACMNRSVRSSWVHPEALVCGARPRLNPRHNPRPPGWALQLIRCCAASKDPPPPLTKACRLTCLGGARF